MKLTEMTPKQFCDATNACSEGLQFALKYRAMSDVWDNCPTANWLLWITYKTGRPDDRTLRLFAIWCARNTPLADGGKTGDSITNPQSFVALDVAERFANGQASQDELAAARAAARDAVWDAAGYAARAAAWYSAWDAAANAAWYSAWDDAADKAQATQFRAMVKNPFTKQTT